MSIEATAASLKAQDGTFEKKEGTFVLNVEEFLVGYVSLPDAGRAMQRRRRTYFRRLHEHLDAAVWAVESDCRSCFLFVYRYVYSESHIFFITSKYF